MDAPPEGTVERWAWDYVTSTDLAVKLDPPPRPLSWEASPPERRIAAPGRPAELVSAAKRVKTPSIGALVHAPRRAQLLHGFLHHELQAAELMAWALLAFPSAPRAMRRGLLGIFDDEVRHMGMYRAQLARLGASFGAFPINDWFWTRVPQSRSPASFTAVMGMGLEGGNLDHAPRFATRLREAGDPEAAEVQEKIGEEEVPHVSFGLHWFEALAGTADFDVWRAHLPRPLTPTMMRGDPLNLEARRRAGYPDVFLERLATWQAPSPGF